MKMKEINDRLAFGVLHHIREEFGVVADTDSYKLTHAPQYPLGATRMASYIESRGGKYDKVMMMGLQMLLVEHFLQPLTHHQVTNIIEFERKHLMDNVTDDLEIALRAVVDDYDGKLPIKISAVPEGYLVPTNNVLIMVETTVPDHRIFSLVSYFETQLVRCWSPMTVATESFNIRKIILAGLEESADDPMAEIPFKLHDFGSRGVSSSETAAFNGAAHLVSFQGSDTTLAVLTANIVYDAEMSASSIPASEHSTTSMHGRHGEEQFLDNMFENYAKPGAIFATVIDTYDWVDFVRALAPLFKERLAESGAKWVFRPDSGDPIETPIQVVRELDKIFGHTVNTKGYKVLNGVGVIQGDGIDKADVQYIITGLLDEGWSISNMAWGMGGSLLQKNNRDTQKFSMKCCAVEIDGEWREVYKDPAVYNADWTVSTEKSFKESKRGRLELMYDDMTKDWCTIPEELADTMCGISPHVHRMLEPVYESNMMLRCMTMDEVRRNAGII